MRTIFISLLLLLSLTSVAQTEQNSITVTENIAYRRTRCRCPWAFFLAVSFLGKCFRSTTHSIMHQFENDI